MKTKTSVAPFHTVTIVILTALSATLMATSAMASSAMASELVCRMKFNFGSTGGPALVLSADRTEVKSRIGSFDFKMQKIEAVQINEAPGLSMSGTLVSRMPCSNCAPGYFKVELAKNADGRFEGTSFAYTSRINRRGVMEIVNTAHMNLLCD